jgi:hypothetical protein
MQSVEQHMLPTHRVISAVFVAGVAVLQALLVIPGGRLQVAYVPDDACAYSW